MMGAGMARRRWSGRSGLAVVVLATALLFAFALPAYAKTSNEPCTACHSTEGQWSVGDVDRSTACVKCHTSGLLGSHPYHNPGSNCGAVCHPGWGASTYFATPSWQGPQGTFASAASPDTPASVLHVIHSNSRWVAGLSTADSKCASCHSVAACTACHEDAPTTGHSEHSATGNATYPKQDPWTGVMGSGIVGEDQTVETATEQTNQCATAGCHNIAGTQSRAAVTREDNAAGVVKSPAANWTVRYGSNYTGGRTAWSNKTGSLLTFTYTGEDFEFVTDKDPYRGKFGVSVDGGPEQIIDSYAAVTGFQQILYRSQSLAQGTHTVTIRVTGQKNPAARGTYVFVDAFRYYGVLPDSVSPDCTSCHGDKATGHGFAHEASQTAGVYKSYTCDKCHDLTITAEHKRSSSKTAADGCTACHTVSADYTLDLYNYTCSQSGGAGAPACHQGSSVPHLAEDSSHTVTPVAATTDCINCHGDKLGVIHDDTNASRPQHASLVGEGSNGQAYDTSCLTCHSTTVVPSTKSCVDAACHAASGVVSMATHPAVDHDAAPALNEASLTGGKACSTCHAVNAGSGKVELVSEHGKSSSKTDPGNAVIGCGDCHNAGYFPTDWMNQNNTCVACHPGDNSKAGMPHEADEYSAKHNFSADAGNATTCGSGAGTFCHATDTADVIHDASNPGTGDCESCHTAAVRQAGVPTTRACSACHSVAHNMNKHVTAASAECVRCHESADVRDIHADCATCHANPSYPGITRAVPTADCVNCHNATGVYGSDYAPYDPEHATGYETTHTASGDIDGNYASLADCSLCHLKTMGGAHEGPTDIQFDLAGYADQCVACHELKVDNLAVKPWNKNCSACHAAGTVHQNTTAAHNATNVPLSNNPSKTIGESCSGAGCHTSMVTWVMGGHACERCHVNATTKPTLNCGDCHPDKTGAHEKHDLDVTASNYNNATQSGCTNSDAGCHGADSSANFGTPYHPSTGCTGGKCHASATYPSTNFPVTGGTCQDCHDGTYVNAPNVSVLAQATAGGHYNETTHTATPAGTVSAGGTYSAACTDCHNPVNASGIDGLYNQHQGLATLGSTTCSDCHNKNAAIKVIVTDSTRTNTCDACHTAAVLPTMAQHGTTAPAVAGQPVGGCSAGITGCHANIDIHALHKSNATGGANGCLISGCHDATKQAAKPNKITCGTGGDCHTGEAHPGAATAHDASTKDTGGCIDCHEESDIRNQHPGGCATCHNGGTNVGSPSGPNTANCTTCHGDEVGSYSYTGRTTASGHYTSNTTTHTANYVGQETPLTGSIVTPGGWGTNNYSIACASCHLTDLMGEHALSSVAFSTVPGTHDDSCVGCHEIAVDDFTQPWVWNKRCDACHTGAAGLAPTRHGAMATKHDATGVGSPGSSNTTNKFTDTYETNNIATIWNGGGTAWTRVTTGGNANTAAMRSGGSTTARVTYNNTAINTAGATSVQLRFWYKESFTSGTDYLTVEYSPTSPTAGYTQVWTVAGNAGSTTGQTVTVDLPANAASSTLYIRFTSKSSSTTLYSWVDDVYVDSTVVTPPSGAAACGSPASDCHNLADVAKLHAYDENGDGDRSDAGEAKCDACHKGNGTTQRPTTLDCTTANCHGAGSAWYSNANETSHRAYHDVTTAAIADGAGSGRAAAEVDTSCTGCHEPKLDSDHWYLSQAGTRLRFDGNGTKTNNCAPCHYKTADSVRGADSAVTNVLALNTRVAISNDRHNCTVCHNSTTWNNTGAGTTGYMKMHENRGTVTPANPNNTEFNDTYSGHRSFAFMDGQVNNLGGSGSSFPAYPTQMFKTGVTLRGQSLSGTTMVICTDCHTYSGATGPHGAAMTVALGDGSGEYDGAWAGASGAQLAASGDGISPTTVGSRPVCAKCHDLHDGNFGNNSHSEHWDRGTNGSYCTQCHIRVPHAWKRPRLLARYGTDPAAYLDSQWTDSGLRAIARKNYETTWQKADCNAGCSTGRHPTQSTPWP